MSSPFTALFERAAKDHTRSTSFDFRSAGSVRVKVQLQRENDRHAALPSSRDLKIYKRDEGRDDRSAS